MELGERVPVIMEGRRESAPYHCCLAVALSIAGCRQRVSLQQATIADVHRAILAKEPTATLVGLYL
jgi:hypothetical protein